MIQGKHGECCILWPSEFFVSPIACTASSLSFLLYVFVLPIIYLHYCIFALTRRFPPSPVDSLPHSWLDCVLAM
jgi:hypothetical protein